MITLCYKGKMIWIECTCVVCMVFGIDFLTKDLLSILNVQQNLVFIHIWNS